MLRIALVLLGALAAAWPVSSIAEVEQKYTVEYLAAVADYYDFDFEAVEKAVESGIVTEELPVVFFIAREGKVDPKEVIETRKAGQSFQKIASKYGLTPADFRVRVTEDIRSEELRQTFDKLMKKTSEELKQASFDDVDFVRLANFKFLYRHYNYSAHLVLTWMGEGKTFVEINRAVYAATTEMKAKRLADNK
jgi:hypothetical protein